MTKCVGSPSRRKNRKGVTLIEGVVVLSVILFSVSIFTPLVLQVREQVRISECANNMRWMGEAWLAHESAQSFLPSSGWGWRWTGDPDRGFGKTQPGGWAFDMIRFSEFQSVADQGGGLPDALKAQGMLRSHQTPIPRFYCPARRPVTTYPTARNGTLAHNLGECQSGSCSVVRIDYQANSGNVSVGETGGPSGDRSTNLDFSSSFERQSTGVTTQISQTRLAQIVDGQSKTMMLGEKYLNPDNYRNGVAPSDDNSAYVGLDRDVNGYSASALFDYSRRTFSDEPQVRYLPHRDRSGLSFNYTFGSAHAGGFNATYCDGSVRYISYGIDHRVFFLAGGRSDELLFLPD